MPNEKHHHCKAESPVTPASLKPQNMQRPVAGGLVLFFQKNQGWMANTSDWVQLELLQQLGTRVGYFGTAKGGSHVWT